MRFWRSAKSRRPSNRASDAVMPKLTRLLLIACLVAPSAVRPVRACPFCSAVSQTLTQEIEAADVSVIARLVTLPPEFDLDADAPLDLDDPDSGTAEFEVVEVIRGDDAPPVGSKIRVVYFGSNEQKKQFLVNGLVGSRIDWATPLPLTDRAIEYIKSLGTLPEKGGDRLAFFLNHLEDEDPLLAQDAYDEFGRSPYEDVIEVGDRMDRKQLLEWIEDAGVGPTRRRLYLTMLGICGQPEDIPTLESLLLYDYQQMKPGIAACFATIANAGHAAGVTVLNEMVKADVRRKQQCLDALIAAYLKLEGPKGLPLIESRFLANPAAEYTQVYAAVMALRFHGEEDDTIPKDRLLKAVRLILDNDEIADQVIPDLARWEDWSVLDQLVLKFKASEENAWIRQPVIAYLLTAEEQPGEVGERAAGALEELERLDPKGVKQARSYMAFGLLARTRAKKDAAKDETPPPRPSATTALRDNPSPQGPAQLDTAAQAPPDQPTIAAITSSESTTSAVATAQDRQPVGEQAAAKLLVPNTTPPGPSTMVIVGGPLIAGVFLFGVFALLLRGADVRHTDRRTSGSDS